MLDFQHAVCSDVDRGSIRCSGRKFCIGSRDSDDDVVGGAGHRGFCFLSVDVDRCFRGGVLFQC